VWKSVYPESIFDVSYSLLGQFELESPGSGVAVSSLLTLGDTAASAVLAVTLTAMRKVTAPQISLYRFNPNNYCKLQGLWNLYGRGCKFHFRRKSVYFPSHF